MRITALIIFLASFNLAVMAQKISYSIPDGYENDISKEDYKKIVDMAVPLIAERYTIEFVKKGTVQLTAGQSMQLFYLDNLILKCIAEDDRALWDKIIQQHFSAIFSSLDAEKNMEPQNYESMKPYLSLRIYPAETMDQRGGTAQLVTRTDLEGTFTVLMLDLPAAFTPVQKQMFDLWHVAPEAAFRQAQDNVNKQQIEKVSQQFEKDSVKIMIHFLGNEDYAASYALDLLNNTPEFVGAWGAAVAIPNKGLVDICAIGPDSPVDFVQFIQMTKPLTDQSYMEHPQPVSDQYFWYYEGTFTKIKVEVDVQGRISVFSPMGLTQLMIDKR